MALRTQDNTALMLFRQAVGHEHSARKNFDYFTGQNSSQKFYQGRLKSIVDGQTKTWVKD